MSESIIPMPQELEQNSEISRFDEIRRRASQLVGRAALAAGLIAGSTVAAYGAETIVNEQTVGAVVNNYPDSDAYDCSSTYGKSAWCKGGQPNSSRGYWYRNCTDWAAWRIPQIIGRSVPYGLGSADTWDDRAASLGFEVDNTPEVGDAAVWESQHVAVVESVNSDGSVNISEYNTGYSGRFGMRSNVRAHHYVDFTPSVNEGNTNNDDGERKPSKSTKSDFNGNGRSDILLYSKDGNDHVFHGRANRGDLKKTNINLDNNYQIVVGNFNGDGEDDFVAYGQGSNPDYIFYGQPNAGDFNRYNLSIKGNYTQLAAGDFDGDGIDDIALYAEGTGVDKVMSGTRTAANFSRKDMNVQLEESYQISSGDYNQDGRDDIFLYNPNGTDYTLYGRKNQGEFGKYTTLPQVNEQYKRPVSGDFNDDGRDDVFLHGNINAGNDKDRVFFGRKNAGEFGVVAADIKNDYIPIAAGDYDGDGIDDIFLHGPGGRPDRILYGSKTEGDFDVKHFDLDGSYEYIAT